MSIVDMRPNGRDIMGDTITSIYGLKPPEYAVYSTDRRLLIQYADEPGLNSEQRKGISPLNPVRGEINGLIDGWRISPFRAKKSKVVRYDRRVADALIVALEHDVSDAATILDRIKQDIIDDRTSWARLEYLLFALGAGLVMSFVSFMVVWLVRSSGGGAVDTLLESAAIGALGAFFSIALNVRSRAILPDLHWISNGTDACLRVLIGFIGASVLMAMLMAKLVTINLGTIPIASGADENGWLIPLIIGFLAGFSERLVPDLLGKAETAEPSPGTMPQAQALPAADAGRKKQPDVVAAGDTGKPAEAQANAGPAQDASAGADDAPQAEAHLDHCMCEVEVQPTELTHDTELPAASGGVATVTGGQAQ